MSDRRKPFLHYKDVRVFYVRKGARALSYIYALEPNLDAETTDQPFFDVRKLPSRYTESLTIEDISTPLNDADFVAKIENEREAHREAMRRAIDGGHDFVKSSAGIKFKGLISTIFNR